MDIDISSKEGRDAFYNSHTWRKLADQVKRRDNYECQHCKAQGLVRSSKQGVRLIADHIEELKDRPDLALDPTNLRTLCHDCHERRHGNRSSGTSSCNRWAGDEWY